MTPVLLRQLWSVIEHTHSSKLLSLDDASLVQWILRKLQQNLALDRNDLNAIDRYLQAKTSLVRDLAQQRGHEI